MNARREFRAQLVRERRTDVLPREGVPAGRGDLAVRLLRERRAKVLRGQGERRQRVGGHAALLLVDHDNPLHRGARQVHLVRLCVLAVATRRASWRRVVALLLLLLPLCLRQCAVLQAGTRAARLAPGRAARSLGGALKERNDLGERRSNQGMTEGGGRLQPQRVSRPRWSLTYAASHLERFVRVPLLHVVRARTPEDADGLGDVPEL